MLSVTLWLLTVLVPLQILLGDMQGLNTLQYQPAKLAAIEAHWNRESARAADPVRHSRQAGRDQSLRHRGAAAGQPDPDP